MAYRLRSFAKATAWILATVLGVVLLAAGGLYLRLVAGPIDAPIPQSLLDRMVAEAAPGWRVEAGGARLDFSSDDGLNGLQLRDVVLIDADGNDVVNAPRLGLRFALTASLDPREALTLREVALSGATVEITRDTDGSFQFDIDSDSGARDGDDPLEAIMRDGVLDMLPRLRIEDARIAYTDLERGTTWRTEHARLTIDPSSTGLAGELALALEGGTGGAVLEAFRQADTGDTTATLRLNKMTPSKIAGIHPVLAELARIDAPLTGSVAAQFEADGSIQKLDTDLTAGAGLVRLTGDEPTALKSFSARLSCDSTSRACNISELAIMTPDIVGRVSGGIERVGDTAYRGELVLYESVLRIPANNELVGATGGTVTAQIDTESGFLIVEKVALKGVTLPGGVSVAGAELNGSLDRDTLSASVPHWRLESVRAEIEGGKVVTLAEANGRAAYDGSVVSITDIFAETLAMGNAEARASGAGTLSGEARYTVAEALLDIDLSASGVSLADPSMPEAARATDLTVAARIDLDERALTGGTIAVRDAVVSLPDLYDAPVRLSKADLRVKGKMGRKGVDVVLQKATAVIDDLPARASGTFAFGENGRVSGKVTASLGPVDFSKVPGHWPKPVAPGGLYWISENVKRGQVDDLKLAATFDTAAPDDDILDLNFAFSKAALTFAPGMPPVTGARGKGKVTLDRLEVVLAEGQVDVPAAGALALKGSEFSISDFSPDVPKGEVKLRASGGIRSVLHLLDMEPLGVISPTGFDIAKATGRADVRVLLTLPLAADLSVDDVQFDARAKVHKYALREPKTGAAITGDLMLVKAQPDGLTLQSDARVDGLSARIGYRQEFERQPKGAPDSVLTLDSFLTLEDFARNGVDLSEYLSGLTALSARVDLFDTGLARFTADADLTNLALKVDRIGWRKSPGVPATVKLTGTRGPDGAGKVEALALRGNGMTADGALIFDGDGVVSFAQFSQIALGRSLDIGLRYIVKPEGGATLRVEGPRLDLRTAFANAIDGAGKTSERIDPSKGAVTDISVNVARVLLRDDLTVVDTRGDVRLRDDGFSAANIEGLLNGTAPAKLLAERRSDGLALRLTSPDGGGFVRATGVFDAAHDGRMMLDARTTDTVSPSRIRGVIRFDNVTVRDSKTMRDIFSGGAIASLIRDMASDGIAFEKIQMPFTGVGSLWNIENGVAFGPSLGLTLDGSYDLSARRLDLDGSVSPAYAINGALGKVPLLGQILTGGEGEGVFGVTFSVEGNSDHPSVSVNPLSALAPGFLRKIVAEVGKGDDSVPPAVRRAGRAVEK